jgi:hypothetical protein
MKSKILIIIITLLLTLIISLFCNFFPNQFGYFLIKSDEYVIYNNESQKIACNIFKYNRGNELILYFNEINQIYTIVLDNELIGVNDFGFGFNTFFNNTFLYLNPKSMNFTPLNVGTFSLDREFKIVLIIDENTISFSTNKDLQLYGKKIIIKHNR